MLNIERTPAACLSSTLPYLFQHTSGTPSLRCSLPHTYLCATSSLSLKSRVTHPLGHSAHYRAAHGPAMGYI